MSTDETIFSRSFSRQEQKKMACGAFIGCLIMMALALCTLFRPYLAPLPFYFHAETRNVNKPIVHNLSNSRADVYEINGDVRIHGISSTIFIVNHDEEENINNLGSPSWTVRPYARKGDAVAMGRVSKLKIKQHVQHPPHCNQSFGNNITAIVFSVGGYAGNHFHALSDVLIPLFLTCQQFMMINPSPTTSLVFLVTNKYSLWTSKYKVILEKLTKYALYDTDKENKVLCFSRMIIGLKAHKEFTIDDEYDPSTHKYHSMRNFTKFLRSAYSLQRESLLSVGRPRPRPRMLIISRRKGRHLMNKDVVAEVAGSLGFDVVVKQMVWDVALVAKLVNSFDVLMGVHGAGLTNMVFLPENAVVIQITPFGLDSLAKTCFQQPAVNMKLRYLEYKATLNESSLLQKYSQIIYNYRAPDFDAFRSVYLDNQDINIDLGRFRGTLLRALQLLPD